MSAVTLGPTITATGISAPSYATILSTLQSIYQGIFGSDAYLDPDSQDGQLLAIFAQAISDCNTQILAAYANFSPATGRGSALSSMVKINGLARNIPSNSTAPCTIVGVAGTIITNGQAVDTSGNIWILPASITIPPSGSEIVTVTAQNEGAISAGIGEINGINTPTLGWQSITNTAAATPGSPVETDGKLRVRQAASVALPSISVLDGIYAAVANVAGVTAVEPYENATSSTDGNGVPAHAISFVVGGGSATDIANAIMLKKSPGVVTYGSTSVTVNDPNGYPVIINFFVLAYQQIYIDLTIQPLTGYVATTGILIQNALAQFVNSLSPGAAVEYFALSGPATLSGDAATVSSGLTQTQLDALKATYKVTSMTVGTTSSPTGTSDVAIPFNEGAQTSTSQIVLTVP